MILHFEYLGEVNKLFEGLRDAFGELVFDQKRHPFARPLLLF